METLYRLLDEATWPEYDLIVNGELYAFVKSDDPAETRVYKVLYQ